MQCARGGGVQYQGDFFFFQFEIPSVFPFGMTRAVGEGEQASELREQGYQRGGATGRRDFLYFYGLCFGAWICFLFWGQRVRITKVIDA
jgi:hypothetical protein